MTEGLSFMAEVKHHWHYALDQDNLGIGSNL